MNQKGFANFVLVGVIVILVALGGYFAWSKKLNQSTPANQQPIPGIVIEEPTINREVKLPITVKGYLTGEGWGAFEGVAGSVQVFDANNKAVSNRTPLEATTDWMKFPVYFNAVVGDRQMMNNLATQTGVLVFKSENPKGDSSTKEFRLPIKFTK